VILTDIAETFASCKAMYESLIGNTQLLQVFLLPFRYKNGYPRFHVKNSAPSCKSANGLMRMFGGA